MMRVKSITDKAGKESDNRDWWWNQSAHMSPSYKNRHNGHASRTCSAQDTARAMGWGQLVECVCQYDGSGQPERKEEGSGYGLLFLFFILTTSAWRSDVHLCLTTGVFSWMSDLSINVRQSEPRGVEST